MLAHGEDELICDFAETYHILDIRALPVPLLATLASGLRDDSRIKIKLSGSKISMDMLLRAMTVDRLGRIFWVVSGNARAKEEPPELVADILRGKTKKKEDPDNGVKVYETPEDFQRAWKELTDGNGTGKSICTDNPVDGGDQV